MTRFCLYPGSRGTRPAGPAGEQPADRYYRNRAIHPQSPLFAVLKKAMADIFTGATLHTCEVRENAV